MILGYFGVGMSWFSLPWTISHIFLAFHRMSNFGLYDGHGENYSTEIMLFWKVLMFLFCGVISSINTITDCHTSYVWCLRSALFLKTYLQSIISLSWSSWLQEWARDLGSVFLNIEFRSFSGSLFSWAGH